MPYAQKRRKLDAYERQIKDIGKRFIELGLCETDPSEDKSLSATVANYLKDLNIKSVPLEIKMLIEGHRKNRDEQEF